MQKGKGGRGCKGKGEIDYEEMVEERCVCKKGKCDVGSDSEYSYKSVYSVGGIRYVWRRWKWVDGMCSGSEFYYSDQDVDGEVWCRCRR